MRALTFLTILFMSLSLTSCFSDKAAEAEEKLEEASNNVAEALKNLEKQVNSNNDEEVVEPVSFRDFEKYFPDKVKGYKKTDFGGETTSSMGFTLSQAKAKYIKGDDKGITVQVTDAGGFGAAMVSLASWSMIRIDKEDSNTLERTGKLNGHKSYEKWDKRRNRSEIALIIDDRLLFSAQADDMSLDDLKDFIEDFEPGDMGKAL